MWNLQCLYQKKWSSNKFKKCFEYKLTFIVISLEINNQNQIPVLMVTEFNKKQKLQNKHNFRLQELQEITNYFSNKNKKSSLKFLFYYISIHINISHV